MNSAWCFAHMVQSKYTLVCYASVQFCWGRTPKGGEEINKMGYSNKVQLSFGEARQTELPEKVDCIIGS